MRLFISINFNVGVKGRIIEIENKLKEYALKGNFTRAENLHLTLVFLGKVNAKSIEKIELAMNHIAASPFILLFNDIGCFMKSERINSKLTYTEIYGKDLKGR